MFFNKRLVYTFIDKGYLRKPRTSLWCLSQWFHSKRKLVKLSYSNLSLTTSWNFVQFVVFVGYWKFSPLDIFLRTRLCRNKQISFRLWITSVFITNRGESTVTLRLFLVIPFIMIQIVFFVWYTFVFFNTMYHFIYFSVCFLVFKLLDLKCSNNKQLREIVDIEWWCNSNTSLCRKFLLIVHLYMYIFLYVYTFIHSYI